MLSRKGMLLAAASLIMGATSSHADDAGKRVRLMFYNTYNLFDAEHDEGKDDWTFLGKDYPGKMQECEKISNPGYRQDCLETDWTQEKVDLKISQIGNAIRAANKQALPDIIGLCEIENLNVVGMLAKNLGYTKFLASDSPDERGIDLGLMYRESASLKFKEAKEYPVKDPAVGKATRNILEAKFEVNGEALYVYVNHWPSQGAPAPARIAAAKVLRAAAAKRLREDSKANVIAMGDFNTVDTDYPHPFYSLLADNSADGLTDVQPLFQASRAPRDVKASLPNGTYFFVRDMTWNRLDRFFVNKNLKDGRGTVGLDAASYRILAPELIRAPFKYNNPDFFSYGTVVNNVPIRGNFNATNASNAGYSDHFPIAVELQVN